MYQNSVSSKVREGNSWSRSVVCNFYRRCGVWAPVVVYKVMKCVKDGGTTQVLLGKLRHLRCENCSDTNVTLIGGNGLGVCGYTNHMTSLRGCVRNGSASTAVNVTRAQ